MKDFNKWKSGEKVLFIVDAETNGLYGDILSIGAIVINSKEEIIDQYYAERSLSTIEVDDEWTKKNVIPKMEQICTYTTERDLLDSFWLFWEKYKDISYCLADVAFPVEFQVFKKCVLMDEERRKNNAPFPILDLSSFLFILGIDPLTDREELVENNDFEKKHHALFDAIICGKICTHLFRDYS